LFGYVSFSEAPFSSLGGVYYNVSIQESSNIVDVSASGQYYPGQVVELFVAVDSPPSTLVTRGTFCFETANASEQYLNRLDGLVLFTDSANITEFLSGGTLFVSVTSTTARPSDTYTPISVFNPIVVNTVRGIDFPSTNNNQFFSLTDNLVRIREFIFAPQAGSSFVFDGVEVAGFPTGSPRYKTEVNVSFNVSEQITSVVFYLYPTLVTESARVSPQVNAANLYLSRVHELSYVTDSIFSKADVFSSVSETANYTDVINTNADIYISVFESSGIFDSIVSGTPYFASLSDSAGIGDVIILKDAIITIVTEQVSLFGVFFGDDKWDPIDPSQNPVWVAISDAQNPNWIPVGDHQVQNWQIVDDSQTVLWQNVDDSQSPNWQVINDSQ
jgi:hypothetical protein